MSTRTRKSTGCRCMRPVGFEDVTAERFPWEVERDNSDDLVALFSTFSGMRIRPPAEQAQMLERIRRRR